MAWYFSKSSQSKALNFWQSHFLKIRHFSSIHPIQDSPKFPKTAIKIDSYRFSSSSFSIFTGLISFIMCFGACIKILIVGKLKKLFVVLTGLFNCLHISPFYRNDFNHRCREEELDIWSRAFSGTLCFWTLDQNQNTPRTPKKWQ